ncbi:conserved exported hypothetical protein [Candidatus Nitrotoga sp. BS]|uniref:hypothetical protein n=1 Tax=Candidatus Nitrotoga sp. BS TaxID=2890408 RepID=UPI001EF3837C|nr:hypothetical protein [Candidatus Nitrotoga sp. BS]CAH1196915.1 conserved exported hypothetical protein [Candidatus Nitrotoga sp. BS]
MRRVNSLALLLAISSPVAMAYDGPKAEYNYLPEAGIFKADPEAGNLHPGSNLNIPGNYPPGGGEIAPKYQYETQGQYNIGKHHIDKWANEDGGAGQASYHGKQPTKFTPDFKTSLPFVGGKPLYDTDFDESWAGDRANGTGGCVASGAPYCVAPIETGLGYTKAITNPSKTHSKQYYVSDDGVRGEGTTVTMNLVAENTDPAAGTKPAKIRFQYAITPGGNFVDTTRQPQNAGYTKLAPEGTYRYQSPTIIYSEEHGHLYIDGKHFSGIHLLNGSYGYTVGLDLLSKGKHDICIKIVDEFHDVVALGTQACVAVTV